MITATSTYRLIINNKLLMLLFIILMLYIFYPQSQFKNSFLISKRILVRNMQLSARASTRLSTTAVQSARDQFKPSYSFLSRTKKTLPDKKTSLHPKEPIQDAVFSECNNQAFFPYLKANDWVSITVFPRIPFEETRHEPNKYGVPHPTRIGYPSCFSTCKEHPCDNPYCKITSVLVEGFDSHYGKEPLNSLGKPVYAETSKMERMGRFYHGKDLKNKKEFTCVYSQPKEIPAHTYDLAPNSGANADTSRTHYINEKIKQTRTNKPVIIEEIKKIDNDE